jgi:methylmalonyl-CoA mutase, C-terminal domain
MAGERVLIAKVGLDGHDRGIKVVARILRDAGFEVIYTGLFQTPQTVAAAAVDEDVDAVGLSMLSGAHMTLAPLVVDELRARGSDLPVIVGGIVPNRDMDRLKAAGVAAVLTPGATSEQIVAEVRAVLVTVLVLPTRTRRVGRWPLVVRARFGQHRRREPDRGRRWHQHGPPPVRWPATVERCRARGRPLLHRARRQGRQRRAGRGPARRRGSARGTGG